MLKLEKIPAAVSFDGAAFEDHAARMAARPERLAALRARAEEAMKKEPFAVVRRGIRAKTGNPHDYSSFGPYWWRNPRTENGQPYVRRDGEVNPESVDENTFDAMYGRVETLTLAAYYLGCPAYAEEAVRQIRVWYLDPDTAMTPHMDYAQAIPGICPGRGIGIIDSREAFRLFDAMALLDAAGLLPDDVKDGMREWYTKFLGWLLTSENGADECRQHNNHGTWYDVQAAAAAEFLGRPMLRDNILRSAYDRRLLRHVQYDGSQPYELARTKALSYSAMNAVGLGFLVRMAQRTCCVFEFAEARTPGFPGGKPLFRAAADYLAPYARSMDGFPYPQIDGTVPTSQICRVLMTASAAYGDGGLRAKAEALLTDDMQWALLPV